MMHSRGLETVHNIYYNSAIIFQLEVCLVKLRSIVVLLCVTLFLSACATTYAPVNSALTPDMPLQKKLASDGLSPMVGQKTVGVSWTRTF